MVLGFNLPDWKGVLQESFQNYLQTPLDRQANELQEKFKQFKEQNNQFQKAIIAILFASFCVGITVIVLKE